MRFHTIAAVLLGAAIASAQTPPTLFPSEECEACIRAIEKPVQKCIKMGISFGFDFSDKVSEMPLDERKCVCAEVASNKWVNACRAICPVKLTDSMYARFEVAKPQCVGISAETGSSNSVMGPLAPNAGAALAVVAAAAQAFF